MYIVTLKLAKQWKSKGQKYTPLTHFTIVIQIRFNDMRVNKFNVL